MKIRSLTINNRSEVIVKVVHEVLNLFKVEIVGRTEEADYAQLSVVNRPSGSEPPSVMTEVWLYALDGRSERLSFSSAGRTDELPRAAVHRTIKRNLYEFFHVRFALPPAPWGILHGVRPTKIVHRWLRGGMTPDAAVQRLQCGEGTSHDGGRRASAAVSRA